jgi:ABC-2 type transport system permease protein
MHGYWTLLRRELSGYFFSMTGYIIIAAALFLIGFSFVDLIRQLQNDSTPMPISELFYMTCFFWLILILTTPVITMRLFALEKFSGTFETLMTTPVSDRQVVLAKFSAALVFYGVMWLPLLGCMLLVRFYTNEPSAFDPGVIGSTFFGILLLGGLFLSLGCCASALSRSQVTAAMISLVLSAALFFVSVLEDQLPSPAGAWQSQVLASFALFQQMHDCARGVVDTRMIVFCVSATLLFLFVTLRIVESRRWR